MPRFFAHNPSMPAAVIAFAAPKSVFLVIATLLLSVNSAFAQLPALDLESPILPGGTLPTGPAGPSAAPPVTQASASTIPIGEYPVGSAVHGAPNQVMQTSFVGCTSCGSVGCHGCDDYGPGYQCPPGAGIWIRADYLSWYESGMETIPLVTSSSSIPADPTQLLTLDAAETNIEFGGRDLDDNPRNGWRIEAGAWLDSAATYGIVGRYFSIDDQSWSFSADSDDFNFLGIPFFDPDIDAEDALDLGILNERDGAVDASISSRLQNWEILFRRLEQAGSNYRLDWIYGYRNLRLEESLSLTGRTVVTDAVAGTLGTDILVNDSFQVENQFHGIDFGLTGHSKEGCWSMDFMLKVALGVMNQEVVVDGDQLIQIPGLDPTRNVGGVFSQETNMGTTDNDEFGVIPEFDLNLGYALTPNIDFTIGYTFIYVHGMTRVGTVVDRVVDPGLLVDLDPANSTRPNLNFDTVDYHIHGLNLGVTARF